MSAKEVWNVKVINQVDGIPRAYIAIQKKGSDVGLEVVFVRLIDVSASSKFDNLKSNLIGDYPEISSFSYVAHYEPKKNTTFDAYGGTQPKNVAANYSEYFGYHYVYALVDPRQSKAQPFYIGKGLGNRGAQHESDIRSMSKGMEVGADEESKQVWVNKCDGEPDKQTRIREIWDSQQIERPLVRVIGAMLNEQVALDVESFLIKHVYGYKSDGFDTLTNAQRGHYDHRFRLKGDWTQNSNFDFSSNEKDELIGQPPFSGGYYVYVLRDPSTKKVFYVGKGKGIRLLQHFSGTSRDPEQNPAWQKLDELLSAGFKQSEIGKVIAKELTESSAFIIENVCIQFVYGFQNLQNQVHGHYGELFRRHGDWELRDGLDLEILIRPGGERTYLFAQFLAAGAGIALTRAINTLPESGFDHSFSPFKVRDAGELATETPLLVNEDGKEILALRLFARNNLKIQLAALSHTKIAQTHRDRIFMELGLYPLRRTDKFFFPNLWRNKTDSDLDEVTRRWVCLTSFFADPKNVNKTVLKEISEGLPDYSRIQWLFGQLSRQNDKASITDFIKEHLGNSGAEVFSPKEQSHIDMLLKSNDTAELRGRRNTPVKQATKAACHQINSILNFKSVF
jgi:hypothetical protein